MATVMTIAPAMPVKRHRQQASPRKLRKKLKLTQQCLRRANKKVDSLESTLKLLEENDIMSKDAKGLLTEQFSGMALDLFNHETANSNISAPAIRYSDAIQKFAVTLNFYSPSAYKHLRTIFTLPHPHMLCQWASTLQCEPGFLEDIFPALEERIISSKFDPHCSLIFDSMHIKDCPLYNKNLDKYDGYVDYRKDLQTNSDKEATEEALVFMLVSLCSSWKTPIGYFIGYFYMDKVNAKVQACLVRIALEKCFKHQLIVQGVTCDCTNVNPWIMMLLGCQWLGDQLNSLIDFNFTSNNKMHYIPDACHLLKLAQNALGDEKIMFDKEGLINKWHHICLLHDIQQEGLKFANCSGTCHIEFKQHLMKVGTDFLNFFDSDPSMFFVFLGEGGSTDNEQQHGRCH